MAGRRSSARSVGPLVAVIGASLAAACSQPGDLGRPQRSMLFGGPVANWATDPPPVAGSYLALTADERAMRDAAYRLRVRPHNLGPIGADPFPASSYADRLTQDGYVYGPARLARIDSEIAADHQSLTTFGHAARRVAVADVERRRALARPGLRASAHTRDQARHRVAENRAFLDGAFADLDRRFAAYAQAIDRTRVETPAVSTLHPDGQLRHLRDRAGSLRYELIQLYQVGEGPARAEPGPRFAGDGDNDSPLSIAPPGWNGPAHK